MAKQKQNRKGDSKTDPEKTPEPQGSTEEESNPKQTPPKPPTEPDGGTEKEDTRLHLDDLSQESQCLLVDVFLEHLRKFLESGKEGKAEFMTDVSKDWKDLVIPASPPEASRADSDVKSSGGDSKPKRIVKEEEFKRIQGANLGAREFDKLLRLAAKHKVFKLSPRRDESLERRVRDRYSNARAVVVGGASSTHYYQIAANQLIQEIVRIGSELRKAGHETLNIGLVSGSTVAGVIDRAVEIEDWSREFGIDPDELPKEICVFALNVCLTAPDHLNANVTILAFRLASKINEQCGPGRAKAYGLSAPLIVLRKQLERYDSLPETREVIEITDPGRLLQTSNSTSHANDSSRDSKLSDRDTAPIHSDKSESQLDIVLTSVGQRTRKEPGDKRSIFYQLSVYVQKFLENPDFNIDKIAERGDMQGDLVYTPINRDGEEIPIPISIKAPEEGSSANTKTEEDELLFYSAIRLKTLESIANNSKKAVILVARYSEGSDKSLAIKAAIGNQRRYASYLIIDEETADRIAPEKR